MSYFRKIPDLLYPTLRNERTSSKDYTLIKNLFKRAKIRDDLINIFTAFERYKIVGDDRPDTVSQKIYGDSFYDWLILLTNEIQNIRTDWPMSQSDLNNYITEKYTPQELSQIHHYETRLVRDSSGNIIMPEGIVVDSDFIITYSDYGQLIENTADVISVSYFENEIRRNDDKRNILILRPEYINTVEKDLQTLYISERESSEFYNTKTLKTFNPRTS
jgi:hypothetical protein